MFRKREANPVDEELETDTQVEAWKKPRERQQLAGSHTAVEGRDKPQRYTVTTEWLPLDLLATRVLASSTPSFSRCLVSACSGPDAGLKARDTAQSDGHTPGVRETSNKGNLRREEMAMCGGDATKESGGAGPATARTFLRGQGGLLWAGDLQAKTQMSSRRSISQQDKHPPSPEPLLPPGLATAAWRGAWNQRPQPRHTCHLSKPLKSQDNAERFPTPCCFILVLFLKLQ